MPPPEVGEGGGSDIGWGRPVGETVPPSSGQTQSTRETCALHSQGHSSQPSGPSARGPARPTNEVESPAGRKELLKGNPKCPKPESRTGGSPPFIPATGRPAEPQRAAT